LRAILPSCYTNKIDPDSIRARICNSTLYRTYMLYLYVLQKKDISVKSIKLSYNPKFKNDAIDLDMKVYIYEGHA
jgi:hypothetical protein